MRALWLWKNNSYKANKRINPYYFPGELSGNVQIDDENILGMPMYYLATKVGSVFQNPRTQFFNVDVDSEIAFGIENIAVPPDELHQRLEYTLDSLKICKYRAKIFLNFPAEKSRRLLLLQFTP